MTVSGTAAYEQRVSQGIGGGDRGQEQRRGQQEFGFGVAGRGQPDGEDAGAAGRGQAAIYRRNNKRREIRRRTG
jgi:hypothetical protein